VENNIDEKIEQIKRNPLLVEVDKFENDEINRVQYIIDNPIGGSVKISNGHYTVQLYLTKYGVEVFVRDKHGVIKKMK